MLYVLHLNPKTFYMEGISPVFRGVLPTNRLRVPYITDDLYDDGDTGLYGFPRRKGLNSTEDAASLIPHFPAPSSLSPFMQSWLFFGLLRQFLRHPIRHADFVSDGTLDLEQDVVGQHFSRWKDELWKASYAKKQEARRASEAMIWYALTKSEVIEEAAELQGQRDPNFALVALSVKLLAGLLFAVLEETFSKSSGTLAPWVVNARRLSVRVLGWAILGPFLLLFNMQKVAEKVMPKSTFAKELVIEMSSDDLRRTLYSHQALPPPFPPGERTAGASTSLLLRVFENNGWCPVRARQLCETFDYLSVNSMAGLIKTSAADENHARCLEASRCTAHDLTGMDDQSVEYRFRHDSQQCDGDCEFVKISYQELATIISSGDKPIISVSIEGALDLKVVRCTPYTTYTAVSHVWSHGRGNPKENSLPQCQLLWLRDRIHQSYHAKYNPYYDENAPMRSRVNFAWAQTLRTVRPHTSIDRKRIYFWMDALCIPVRPESEACDESKKLRFRAIKQITPIFVGAHNALILDKGMEEITGTDPAGLGGDEFASLLIGCTWMERGWTLQEGSLAQNCVVQVMGKPYDMAMALRRGLPTVDGVNSPLARAVVSIRRATILQLWKELLEYKRQIMVEPWYPRAKQLARVLWNPSFASVWNSLIRRSTTRPNDGVLIMASLLDFDVYQLRLVPSKHRLMRVIQGCEELPLSLLYNTGPKVCIDGHSELNWIPQDIRGDNLVLGPSLRKLKPQRANSHVVYSIERGHRNTNTLLCVVTAQGQYIPEGTRSLHIVISADSNIDSTSAEYMIDLQRVDADVSVRAPRLGYFMVIDLDCGTSALRGIVGRGVSFIITSRSDGHWTVRYDAALIARTPEQWVRKAGPQSPPATSVAVEPVRGRQKICMVFGKCIFAFPGVV